MFLSVCLLSQKLLPPVRIRQTMQLSIRLRCTNIHPHKLGLREEYVASLQYTQFEESGKVAERELKRKRIPDHQ